MPSASAWLCSPPQACGRKGVVRSILHRPDYVRVRLVAVVVDAFGRAVAVGVEARAHMRERIPLG